MCGDKEKYIDSLEGKNVIYSYHDAQQQVADRFASMVTHKCSLIELLKGDAVDIRLLKENLGTLDLTSNPDGASSSV